MTGRRVVLVAILIGLLVIGGVALVIWGLVISLPAGLDAQGAGTATAVSATEPATAVSATEPAATGRAATARPTVSPTSLPEMVAAVATGETAVPEVETGSLATMIHVVANGETVTKIAQRYGISAMAIITANDLLYPDRLLVGQELIIPGVAAPGEASPAPLAATSSPIPSPPLPTPQPTATSEPTATATPEPTMTPPSPEPPPDAPPSVNGIARARVALMPAEVIANSRAIFAQGQQMGRNPRAFSKLGDSVIDPPFFTPYDVGNYDLGIYAYLQGVIDYFQGSFARDSASQRIGLHSWTAFDPMWADKNVCLAHEGPLPCELRLHNPAFLVIRLGSNDVGVGDLYEQEMRRIVTYALENGVIPILGTKADRNEGNDYNNQVVRRLASEYQVPLWDFDLVADTIPGRGLDSDAVHLNGDGQFMQNVSGLVVLDRLWREVVYGATP